MTCSHADNHVVTLLLACFAVGVGGGSMLGSRLLRGQVSLRHAAPAALALTAFTLAFAALCSTGWAATWSSPAALLGTLPGLAATLCLVGASAAGGVFSVPLYATLQQQAAPSERARMVAANNVVNALFMVAGAVVIAALAAAGLGPAAILAAAAAL